MAGMSCIKEMLLAEESVAENVTATIDVCLSNGGVSQTRICFGDPITVKFPPLARMSSPLCQDSVIRRTYMSKVTITNSYYNCTSKQLKLIFFNSTIMK